MARKITAGLLEENPKDAEAQKLMGKILEAEISRQKDLFEEKTLEEWTPDETKAEIRTWLERSQLLLTAKQYDQALYAAEKVFIYDPNNQKASELIDSIRQSAYKDGKKDMLVANEMMHDEVQERIERYRHEGHLAIQEKRWGTARLLVQKILLLSPEDPEGLAMQKQVQAQQPQK